MKTLVQNKAINDKYGPRQKDFLPQKLSSIPIYLLDGQNFHMRLVG